MREPTQLEKQQYQRMIELSDIARQRYLDGRSNPRCAADEKYMTEKRKSMRILQVRTACFRRSS